MVADRMTQEERTRCDELFRAFRPLDGDPSWALEAIRLGGKLLTELDAVTRERDEARGELMERRRVDWELGDKLTAASAKIAELVTENNGLAMLNLSALEAAEQCGFERALEASAAWLKTQHQRDFGYWFAERLLRGVPAKVQP